MGKKKSRIDKIMLVLLNLSQRTLKLHLLVIATKVFLHLIMFDHMLGIPHFLINHSLPSPLKNKEDWLISFSLAVIRSTLLSCYSSLNWSIPARNAEQKNLSEFTEVLEKGFIGQGVGIRQRDQWEAQSWRQCPSWGPQWRHRWRKQWTMWKNWRRHSGRWLYRGLATLSEEDKGFNKVQR